MKQREYWQDRIIDWEKACYDQKPESLPLIERVANLFRRAVRYRRQLGFRMLASQPRERVLELGCGSGAFALALLKENVARTMVAVDISTAAIDAARLRAGEAGVGDRVQFIASDLENLDFTALGRFDYVVGLGLTPYLTDKEFERVFKAVGDAPFLFDYHRKGFNYINVAHAVFRAIKGHPFYRLFSSAEIGDLLSRFGVKGFRVGAEGGVDFVYRQ
jgi:methylase of polypeptide subunit release factors